MIGGQIFPDTTKQYYNICMKGFMSYEIMLSYFLKWVPIGSVVDIQQRNTFHIVNGETGNK